MLKSCGYCGRIHDSSKICEQKQIVIDKVKYSTKRVVNEKEKSRYTNAMKRKSLQIKEKANFLCEVCKKKGKITFKDLSTHHIEKLVDNPHLALDDSNLICLCRWCHERAEKGELTKDYLKSITRDRL